MQWHGLYTLADAAQTLERRAAAASPDLVTEREQRKMATRIRQFEEMQAEHKRKAAAATQSASTRSSRASMQVKSVIGKLLWKEFPDENGRPRLYQGEVVSVHYASRSRPYDFGAAGTATVKYFVQYDDGDEEDMKYEDVLKYIIE
jgi:FKBP-type peptidyl-prolyl cis-trans isomerase